MMKAEFYLKTFLPVVLVLAIYTGAIFLIILPYFRTSLLEKKEEAVKDLTTNAISILAHYQNQVANGTVSLDEAKKIASNTIGALRYGTNMKDYFWITDTLPRMIVHPYRPELNGTDLTDYKDSLGNRLFVDAVNIVEKKGGGYIRYLWQRNDDSLQVVPKISYVQLYPEWGWIVGSGIYLNDMNKEIDRVSENLKSFSILIIILILLVAFYISVRHISINKDKIIAQKNLAASEEKYREIVENANAIIIKIDLNGKVTFFNEEAQLLFGYKNDIIGKEVFNDILPINTKGEFSAEKIFSDFRKYATVVKWNSTCDGQKRYISWNNKPIAKANGEITGILSIGTDITLNKQLLDRLTNSRKKFETIFNAVADGIIIISPTGRIIEANETAVKRSGYTKREYLSFPIQKFFRNHPLMNFENLKTELEGRDFVVFEMDYNSMSGEQVNLEIMAKRIKYNGEDAYIAVSRDIKERLQLQHKIYNTAIEAEEEERSRVARELHDGISPILATIKLYSQSLKDSSDLKLRNILSDKIEETINEAIQSISEISYNLSSHILQNFGLIPALENYIEKIKDVISITFQLDFNLEKSYGNTVNITIYRIITEMINNSVKYANAKNIRILLEDKGLIFIKYSDDGVGFDLNLILENKKGMGLFNVKNRIESLKGSVKYTTSPGNGFTVEIEIPQHASINYT